MNRRVDGSPSVLFVDDEEMTRKTFERIASQEFPVLLAGDVAEAKEILQQHGDEIGVLLTDQRMPGGLGVELLEYARELHPDIVRMLTTAYSELEDAIAAVNRGEIIRYIEKPWTNIDALLIDLRVAMRFHLLERSNQELMAEKMSAKAHGARVERLQVLAALASAQPEPEIALVGLEAMLRRLSDLRGSEHLGMITDIGEFYSGPIEEADKAMQLANRFAKPLVTQEAKTWSEISEGKVSGELANAEIPTAYSSIAAEIFARVSALLTKEGAAESTIETSVNSLPDNGIELAFSVTEGLGNTSLNTWVNLGSTNESVRAVADLFRLYVIGYLSSAKIDITFDKDNALTKVQVGFTDSHKEVDYPQQDSDWLEDVLILFS